MRAGVSEVGGEVGAGGVPGETGLGDWGSSPGMPPCPQGPNESAAIPDTLEVPFYKWVPCRYLSRAPKMSVYILWLTKSVPGNLAYRNKPKLYKELFSSKMFIEGFLTVKITGKWLK